MDNWINDIDGGWDAIDKDGWDILRSRCGTLVDAIWNNYTEKDGHSIVQNKDSDYDTVFVINKTFANKWTGRKILTGRDHPMIAGRINGMHHERSLADHLEAARGPRRRPVEGQRREREDAAPLQ